MPDVEKWLKEVSQPVLKSLFAILIGTLGATVVLLVSGYNPLSAYESLFYTPFFEKWGLLRTLTYVTPLVLTALTWSIGMKVGIYNIGAEGQLMLGAGATVAVSSFVLPTGIHLAVAMIFAIIAGMLWSLPAALLKIKRGVHEVVSTIMLNWIGIFFLRFLVSWPLKDPQRAEKSITIAPSSRFPVLVEGSTLTGAIFVSIGFAVLIYFFLWHTKTGQHLRAAGLDEEIARNNGIDVTRMIILAFMLGGGAAGLAGGTLSAGFAPSWTIYRTLASLLGLGFAGIGVGMIGRNHPIGAIFAAIFFGGLWTGEYYLQLSMGVPTEIATIATGIIIISVAVPSLIEILRENLEGLGER